MSTKPKPHPAPKPGKLPRSRVMFAASRDRLDLQGTLVAQPKCYGPSLNVVLAVLPCHTPKQAQALVDEHNAALGLGGGK